MSDTAAKKKTSLSKWIIGLVVACIFITLYGSCTSKSDEKRAQRLAQEERDRTKGFHCLSSWNGSHRKFTEAVK